METGRRALEGLGGLMEKEEYANVYALEERHWWYLCLQELVEHYIKKSAGAGRPLDILDAGCGTGGLMRRLEKYGRVRGMDGSPEAIAFCRKRGLSNAALTDLNDWQPPIAAFDSLVSIDVLYHERIADERAVLDKFNTALKPKGRLIIQVPAFPLLRRRHDAFVQGKRRYRRKPFRDMLNDAGFRCQRLSYRLPIGFLAALAKKAFEKDGAAASSDIHPVPSGLNALCLLMGRVDNRLIRARVPLPFGSSLFAVAEKTR